MYVQKGQTRRIGAPLRLNGVVSLHPFSRTTDSLSQTSPARVLKAAVDQSAVESLKKENEELDVKRRNAEDKIKKCRALQR